MALRTSMGTSSKILTRYSLFPTRYQSEVKFIIQARSRFKVVIATTIPMIASNAIG